MISLFDKDNGLIQGISSRIRSVPVLVACFLALLIMYGGMTIGLGLTLGIPFPESSRGSAIIDATALVVELAVGFGIPLALLWLWLKYFEERSLGSLGLYSGDGVIGKILRGVAVGVLVITTVALSMTLLGFASLDPESAQPTGVAAIGGVLFVALGWTVQASTEEIIFRGWILQTAAIRYGIPAGILVSSLAFVLIHGSASNPLALLNIFLGGVFLALFALYEGSLWGVCAVHTAMNWTEVNIFGFDQLGEPIAGGAIINLRETGPDFLTGGGGAYVTTGGLLYTIVMLLAISTILTLAQRRSSVRAKPTT